MQGIFLGYFEGGEYCLGGVLSFGKYYYCQSEGGEDGSQGGEDSPPSPPPENTLIL